MTFVFQEPGSLSKERSRQQYLMLLRTLDTDILTVLGEKRLLLCTPPYPLKQRNLKGIWQRAGGWAGDSRLWRP